ncbi:ATP-dependent DNA helicase Q-like 3 [Acropora millepora]|uniref:ATP-dependent DNA helicase Q-like 3 n=1 Tax=Acropora millepora TaxID=45264 RepID=UPI001CF3DFA5|nr:ATP-dependent DNA helicase Q-like 3 [Acropora millepora]
MTDSQRRSQAVVVDEAHFVIDWKDFRPSYRKLGILRSIFPQVPLLGMTATATKRPGRDIIESLGMFNPAEVIGNPDRRNIYFSASTRPDRGEDNHSMGNDKYAPKGTLHKAEKRLFTQFHEQYPLKEKERIVDGLIKGTSKLRLVFATVAFGVRLDLDFIRQVIHIGVPYTMEEYFLGGRKNWERWTTLKGPCILQCI